MRASAARADFAYVEVMTPAFRAEAHAIEEARFEITVLHEKLQIPLNVFARSRIFIAAASERIGCRFNSSSGLGDLTQQIKTLLLGAGALRLFTLFVAPQNRIQLRT